MNQKPINIQGEKQALKVAIEAIQATVDLVNEYYEKYVVGNRDFEFSSEDASKEIKLREVQIMLSTFRQAAYEMTSYWLVYSSVVEVYSYWANNSDVYTPDEQDDLDIMFTQVIELLKLFEQFDLKVLGKCLAHISNQITYQFAEILKENNRLQ